MAYAADLTNAILSQSQGGVKYSAFNEEVARQLAGEDRGKVKFSAEDEGDGRYLADLDDRSIEGRKMSSRARRDVNQTMNAVQTELRGLIEAETRAARDTQKQVLAELAQTALDGKNISQEQINDAFETVWNAGRVVDRSAGEAAWDVKEYLRTQGAALSEADQALTARRRRCSI